MSNEQESPLVSVIIPTYKRPNMLGRAIDSVLNQTYDNIEIIVVDDNDEDSEYRKETEEFMEKYTEFDNLVYLKHKENKNGSAARNTGIRKAKGEYVAFLDDDDEWLSEKIEKQIIHLIKYSDKKYKAVFCGFFLIKDGKEIRSSNKLPCGNLHKEILLMNISLKGGSTLLFEKNVIDMVGLFDESFERHQDYEWLVRFFRYYKILSINLPLVKINIDDSPNRVSPNKLVEIKKKYLNKYIKDIKKYDSEIINNIFKVHWLEVSKEFIKDKQIKKGYFYYAKANKLQKIKFITKIGLICKIFDNFFGTNILEFLKRIRNNLCKR